MTVGELIEELQKFPPYHDVFVDHPEDFFASIVDVRAENANSVVIDCNPD